MAGIGGVTYTRWIEPHWLSVGRHEIKLSKNAGQSPLKILQLSDFHVSPVVSLDFVAESIRLGLSLQPDLICMTGDFITHGYSKFDGSAEILSPLVRAAPTFACPGNHDGGLWARPRHGYEDTNNPDTKTALKPYSRDLLLGGHTHGGQVRLPFIGAPIVPVRDKRHVAGLHRWNDRWIHITRGVGNLHGVRFNCPPEVSLLSLV